MVRPSVQQGERRNSHIYHVRDGYQYHFNTIRYGRTYLRCVLYKNWQRLCPGRASFISDGGDFRVTRLHNHGPDHFPVMRLQVRDEILRRAAVNVWRSPSSIVQDVRREARELYNIPRAATTSITSNAMRSAISRVRLAILPPIPATLEELRDFLSDPQYRHLTDTIDGQDNVFGGAFGQFDAGTYCLIFLSRRMADFLRTRRTIFTDGTFSVRTLHPENRQIFNIVTTVQSRVIPLVHVVVQTQTEGCYIEVFRGLRELVPGLNPAVIITDFEKGLQNAILRQFPNAILMGCYFHFINAILKYATELGLRRLVQDDYVASSILRSACALPLLPSHLIGYGLVALGWEAHIRGLGDVFQQFFEYMEREWMPKEEILSVFNSRERTNNPCETANLMLQKQVDQIHPNFWRMIGAFVRSEDAAFDDVECVSQGLPAGRGRRSSALANDERIQFLTNCLLHQEIDILSFLHRASRRVQNVFDEGMDILN